jgi:hypothetical protein
MDNRFARRHPGQTHQVERSIPVKMLVRSDGTQEMIGPDSVVCLTCPCCVIWTQELQEFRDAAVRHLNESHALLPGYAGADLTCQICWIFTGGEPGIPVDVCKACKCCVLWGDQLQDNRSACHLHVKEKHSRSNRFPDTCPVCWIAGGGIDKGRS